MLTFSHNVEARFFLGALKTIQERSRCRGPARQLVAEWLAVRYSDRLITLSERDSRGIARPLWPGRDGCFANGFGGSRLVEPHPARSARAEDYALFVGGAFYANKSGVEWFVDQVAPEVDMKICIVGRGLEALRGRLERCGNVRVVGSVDRLDDWYLNAKVVIAPIFRRIWNENKSG